MAHALVLPRLFHVPCWRAYTKQSFNSTRKLDRSNRQRARLCDNLTGIIVSSTTFGISCTGKVSSYIESGSRAKVCLCFQFSVSTCCVVIEQMSPKKIRYIMTLSYFPDVLPYYFFQNVKFCSRKIPLFLYVRLCHVLHDSRSGPRFNNKDDTLPV